jgi:membrane-associated phospholipid phosphatase
MRGRFTDMHLSRREERPLMMAIGLVSVAVGLGLMALLDAPRELFALVGAMVAGVAVALLISSFWKISIHTSVTAGTVTILILVFGPWTLVLAPLALAVAWARVRLRAHTVGQVLVGGVLGASVALGVYTLLS